MKRPDLLPNTFNGCLSKLIEEMAEAAIPIAKIQLHGFIARDPVTHTEYHNVKDLLAELNDIEHAIYRLRLFAIKETIPGWEDIP